MKKECTCKKIVKDDKVTVLHKCDVCFKRQIKENELLLNILDKMIELKSNIPKYKTGGKNVDIIIDKNNYKKFVVYDGQKTTFPDYLKAKGYSDFQDWLNSISDKNTQRDFNKGMLEADKELQKVCNNNEKLTSYAPKMLECLLEINEMVSWFKEEDQNNPVFHKMNLIINELT